MSKSIQQNLVSGFTIFAIGPMLIVIAVLGWYDFRENQRNVLVRQNEIAIRLAVEVKALIETPLRMLRTRAKSHDINGHDLDARYQDLSILLASNSNFRRIVSIDPNGREVFRIAENEASHSSRGRDWSLDPAFMIPKTQGRLYYGSIEFDEMIGEPFMMIAVPVHTLHSGELHSVIVSTIHLKGVWDLLAKQRVGTDQELFIINEKRRVVAHQNPSVVLKGIISTRDNDDGFLTGLSGRWVAAASREMKIGDTIFRIVAERDGLSAVIPAVKSTALVVMIISIALVAIMFLLFRALRHIAQPIKIMAGAVQDMGKGDFSQRVEVLSEDEIGTLGKAFNVMAENLEQTLSTLQKEVSERKRYESKLQEANDDLEYKVDKRTHELAKEKQRAENLGRRNKMILDAAGDGIYGVDLDGLCTFVNPAAARMAGWDAEDMIGLSNHDILHHTKADGSHYPRTECPIYDAFREGKVRTVSDEVFWRKDGTSFPVEYTSTPIFEDGKTKGAVVVFRDISEQQKDKKDLQDAFEFNESILANSPVGIAIYDPDGQCVSANDAIGEIIGATREQVLSQNYHDTASWKAGGLYDKALECMSTNKRIRYEVHVTTTFGKHTDLDCHLSPLMVNDKQHLLLIFSDMTEARQMQEQLIQSSKMATLGEMATGVAHELNQPLNVIRMAVGNIQKKNEKGTMDADYITAKLDKVVRQVERAAAIIDHMRIFGRKPDKDMIALNPAKVVRDSLGLIGEQLRLADIEVTTDAKNTDNSFLGHQVQVEQVLLNLLANARDILKDKDGGEKRIILRTTLSDDEKNVLIEVEDSGGGIDPDALGRIFEPFYTTKEIGHGTGLGLSISYGIVNDMGGTLEARNTEAGACFTMTMPAIGT